MNANDFLVFVRSS